MYQIYSRCILTQCLLALTFKHFTAKTRTLDTETHAAEDGSQCSKTPTRGVIWQRICSLWANKRKEVWEMKANDFEDLKGGGTSLITNASPPCATVGLSSSSSAYCFLPHPSLNSSPPVFQRGNGDLPGASHICFDQGVSVSLSVCFSSVRVCAK